MEKKFEDESPKVYFAMRALASAAVEETGGQSDDERLKMFMAALGGTAMLLAVAKNGRHGDDMYSLEDAATAAAMLEAVANHTIETAIKQRTEVSNELN